VSRAAVAVVSPNHPDDDRRFVNNPFARKLHPHPSRSPLVKLALLVVSTLGFVIMGAAFLLPLAFVPGLVRDGARDHRWGMVAAGVVMAAVYALLIVSALRKWRAGRRARRGAP
jgi:hypothetical protein